MVIDYTDIARVLLKEATEAFADPEILNNYIKWKDEENEEAVCSV